MTTGSAAFAGLTPGAYYLALALQVRLARGECRWMVFFDSQNHWRISKISKADIVDIGSDLGIDCKQV